MSFHELMLMNALFKLLENTNIYISILIGLVSLMYYDKKFINLNYCSNFFKKKIISKHSENEKKNDGLKNGGKWSTSIH